MQREEEKQRKREERERLAQQRAAEEAARAKLEAALFGSFFALLFRFQRCRFKLFSSYQIVSSRTTRTRKTGEA